MVVHDLDVVGVGVDPTEADPPLVVDADAVLSEAFGRELLQTVRWRHPEVGETGGGIEHEQFAKGGSVKIRWEPPDPFASEQTLGVGVTEAPDHGP